MKKVSVAVQKKKISEIGGIDGDVFLVVSEYRNQIKDFLPNQILEVSIDGEIDLRSLQQLALYWVCCKKVANNTEYPRDKDVSEYVKLRCHYVDTHYNHKGQAKYRTKSISFKEMKQKDFNPFMENAITVMAEMLQVTEEDLLKSRNDTE